VQTIDHGEVTEKKTFPKIGMDSNSEKCKRAEIGGRGLLVEAERKKTSRWSCPKSGFYGSTTAGDNGKMSGLMEFQHWYDRCGS